MEQSITPKPAEISIEDCRKVVEQKLKSTSFEIVDYELLPLEQKTGFLGEHFRLKITIKKEYKNEVMHCFAKFLPDTQAQLDFVISTGAFTKEVFAYKTLFEKILQEGINYLNSCIPECYYIIENYALIFEDVSIKKFKPLSKYKHLDYPQVLTVLTTLSKLHASSLIYEEKLSEKNNKKYRFIDEFPLSFYETFYANKPNHKGGKGVFASAKGLVTEVDMFPSENGGITDKEFKIRVKKLCENIFELVKPSKKFRNVICHGDLWATNFMIKYENDKPSECIFLDFQTVRYKPPAHDFMSFIHLTTTRSFRMEHFDELQTIYYEKLRDLLKEYNYDIENILPYEEFVASCEEERVFAAVQTATYVQLTQIREEDIGQFVEDNEKWNKCLYEDRSWMVLENSNKDPAYKNMLKETLIDLREVCEILAE